MRQICNNKIAVFDNYPLSGPDNIVAAMKDAGNIPWLYFSNGAFSEKTLCTVMAHAEKQDAVMAAPSCDPGLLERAPHIRSFRTGFPLRNKKDGGLFAVSLAALSFFMLPDLPEKLIRTEALRGMAEKLADFRNDILWETALLALLPGKVLLTKKLLQTDRFVSPTADYQAFSEKLQKINPDLASLLWCFQCRTAFAAKHAGLSFPTGLNPAAVFLASMISAPAETLHLQLPTQKKVVGKVRNIAVFASSFTGGGAERCASLLIEGFVKQGYRVTLFTVKPPSPQDYPLTDGVERIVIPPDTFIRMPALQKEIRKHEIDTAVMIEHIWELNLTDALFLKSLGVRVVQMEHNSFAYIAYAGIPNFAHYRTPVYRVLDAVTALSYVDETLWRDTGANACFMPNPLTFSPDLTVPGKRDTHTMLFIGRLTADKGAWDAIKVLGAVKKEFPDTQLILAGAFADKRFEKELRALITALNLEDAVQLTGRLSDVTGAYQQASVLIMPSLVEGYPMTLMEAKAFALPQVIYNMPYLAAAGEDKGCISVKKKDSQGMAEAICRLFRDPETLRTLGDTGKKSLKNYSSEIVFDRWQELFECLENGSFHSGLFADHSDPEHYRIGKEELRIGMEHAPQTSRFQEDQRIVQWENRAQKNIFYRLINKLNRIAESDNNSILARLIRKIIS